MVGTLLAMGLGVKLPHSPAGTQVKFTPAFFVSLVTTAAMPAVALAASAVGGGNSVLNVTRIAGGWYLESPQATSTAIMPATSMALAINRRVDRRKIIGWFDASCKRRV